MPVRFAGLANRVPWRYAAAVRLLLVCSLLLLAGCPKDPATVDRSRSATPCTTDADCNAAGKTCGLLRACVDLRCEATPTRAVHCP